MIALDMEGEINKISLNDDGFGGGDGYWPLSVRVTKDRLQKSCENKRSLFVCKSKYHIGTKSPKHIRGLSIKQVLKETLLIYHKYHICYI